MKRLLALLCVVGFVVALPLAHSAFAKPAAKVAICHVSSANDFVDFGGVKLFFGRQVEVSENAVAAHLAHGDSTDFECFGPEARAELEEWFGIDLVNADCLFLSFPE